MTLPSHLLTVALAVVLLVTLLIVTVPPELKSVDSRMARASALLEV